jgi:hypothetical protein
VSPIYVSIFELHPLAVGDRQILEAYVRRGCAELAVETAGCRRVTLLEPLREGGPVVIVGEWPSRELYEAWGVAPARIALGPELAAYTDGDPSEVRPVGLYPVAHEVTA